MVSIPAGIQETAHELGIPIALTGDHVEVQAAQTPSDIYVVPATFHNGNIVNLVLERGVVPFSRTLAATAEELRRSSAEAYFCQPDDQRIMVRLFMSELRIDVVYVDTASGQVFVPSACIDPSGACTVSGYLFVPNWQEGNVRRKMVVREAFRAAAEFEQDFT